MPVEVTKFTCQFKCGKKATGIFRSMVIHESNCWNNPDNRTCKTCSNEMYEKDGDGESKWYYRGCRIAPLDEMLLRMEDQLQHGNTLHLRPIHKCNFYNSMDTKGAEEFAELVQQEILSKQENTEHFPYTNKWHPAELEVETVPDGLPF